MILLINGLGSVSVFEQLPAAVVFVVEPADIFCGQSAHDMTEWGRSFVDQQMNMVGHQAESKNGKVVLLLLIHKDIIKFVIILRGFEDSLFVNTADNDVIISGNALLSGRSWHVNNLA